MQFKNPEILYFLFLLVVPILVHLFQLRRFKTQYFTNVRFLKALSIQSRKSATIKKWLLLACRLLLLTALIIAFAQPFYLAKDAKNASNELYIILDNSYSMQAKGKKGELLKRAIQELLENTAEKTHFSLLTNTDTYWNTDIKAIKNSLQNLDYSAIPFELENQITKIKAHKTAYNKDIVIITDALDLSSKQLNGIDKKDNTYFIIQKSEQKNNTAIDSVYINKTVDNFYEISVNLSHYGDKGQAIPIAIYNQNQLIAKTQLSFKTDKQTAQFTIPKTAFNGFVSIEDGGLTYDNKLYFSIADLKKNKVTSIGDPQKSNFLKRIYTPDEFDFKAVSLNTLNYNDLENQDAIVLNELEEVPQALQTTLKSFVSKGGNLIIIPATNSTITAINPFLKTFGSVQFQKKETNEKQLTKINFSHPLFKDVFEGKVKNFQYPTTKNSFLLVPSGSVALANNDQSSFLSTIASNGGNVSIFSAALNIENSNFQQSPLIVPSFYKMAISNQNNTIKAFTIGNSNTYFVTAAISKDAILTVKNKDEQFIPIQQVLNNKVKLLFNDYPLHAGNFEILKENKNIEPLSFNYSRTESNLAPANLKILDNYKTIDSIEAVYDSLQSDRTDNQIWKWFVIFALFFLLSEMAIIRFMK